MVLTKSFQCQLAIKTNPKITRSWTVRIHLTYKVVCSLPKILYFPNEFPIFETNTCESFASACVSVLENVTAFHHGTQAWSSKWVLGESSIMPQLQQKLKCTVPNLQTDVKLLYLCWGQCLPGLQQQHATLQVLPLVALNDNLASQAFLQRMYPVFH